jgi:hypothetical protein
MSTDSSRSSKFRWQTELTDSLEPRKADERNTIDKERWVDLDKGSSENYLGWRALLTYPSDLVFIQLTSRHESRRKSFFTERQCILTNPYQGSAICIQSYLICNTGYTSFSYFDIVSNSPQ